MFSPAVALISSRVSEEGSSGRKLAEKPGRKLRSNTKAGNNFAKRDKSLALIKQQRPKETFRTNNGSCREVSCQKITDKLKRAMEVDADENAYFWLSKQLQEALLNYQMVLDFSQTIDNGRWRFLTKESQPEISTKTAGKIVSTLFQSIELLKHKPSKRGNQAENAVSSLVYNPETFSWDSLFRNICCLVVHLGFTESDFTQRLRLPASSSSTVLFDMTRDQVELCLNLLSEQCQKVIPVAFLPCTSPNFNLISMDNLVVMMKCISCILQRTPSISLPAPELTAQSIVSNVLLQIIDHANISCMAIMTNTSLPLNLDKTDDCLVKLYEAANLALDIISALVKNKHFAIALLCPLVVEVSKNGQETSISNPIRRNMVELIQTSFAVTPVITPENSNTVTCSSNDHYDLVCQRFVFHACLALISIVEAATVIQRSNLNLVMDSAEGMLLADMDGSSIARRIRTLLLTGSRRKEINLSYQLDSVNTGGRNIIIKCTRIISVQLLASIARGCSFLISSHWELFFSDIENSHSSPHQSRGLDSSPLLSLVHRGTCKYDHDQMLAVLSAVEELLRNMPFKQMLIMANIKTKPLKSSDINNGHSSGFNTRNLAARMYGTVSSTIDTLVDELDASWSRFRSKTGWKEDESIVLILGVLRTIMTNVPFDSTGICNSLNDSIGRKLSLVSCIFFSISSSPALAATNPEMHAAAASVLMSSMGGKITQSGSLTHIPIPTRLWLRRNFKFIVTLLNICCTSIASVKNDGQKSPILDRLNILQSVVRVAPWIFADADVQCLVMKVILHHLSFTWDIKIRLKTYDLIKSLLMGRQDFGIDEECRNIDFSLIPTEIIPAICASLKDQMLLIRASAVSALAELSPSDWFFFCKGLDVSVSAKQSLFLVTELCKVRSSCGYGKGKDNKQLSNVRAEACKSLGKICTTLLGPEVEEYIRENLPCDQKENIPIHSFCNVLYKEGSGALLDSCKDQNAAVRGMAIFAVGNLSRALNESKGRVVLQSCSLHLDLCHVTVLALNDEDEKVVGNAIRTIGHLIEGLFSLPKYSDSWAEENGIIELFGSVSENLAARIHQVLLDASGVGVDRLTWRQRSNAKKHAWGACRGLRPLLSNSIMSRKCIAAKVLFAIESLIGCLDQALVLHVKIVSSAVSTLRSISLDVWRHFSSDERIIGNGIKACVEILSSSEVSCS